VYRFISTPPGPGPHSREWLRAVRSHAASVSQPNQRPRRRSRPRRLFEGEAVLDFSTQEPLSTSTRDSASARHAIQPTSRLEPSYPGLALINDRLHVDILAGRSFSPISHLSTYSKPYVPGIIQHYVHNLTIPVPEIDGSSTTPLFRAVWIPVVLHDPVVFQIIVLFAATHFATFADPSQYNSFHTELLSLKQSALSALIQRVQSEHTQTSPSSLRQTAIPASDTLLAAAAKMASYEAIFGTLEVVRCAPRILLVQAAALSHLI
jgi:hypothetical protein